MKKITRNATFVAILCLATAGCQKDDFDLASLPLSNHPSCTAGVNVLAYTVDGEQHEIPMPDSASGTSYLEKLFALAKEGKSVTFSYRGINCTEVAKKETVTFVTPSMNEAMQWSDNMARQGYTVSVEYDARNNVFVCTAVR